jgi:hypothetical protein
MSTNNDQSPRRAPPAKAAGELPRRLEVEQQDVRDVTGRRVDIRQSGLRDVHADVVSVRQAGLGRVAAQEVDLLQSSVGVVTGGAVRVGPNTAAGLVAGRDVSLDQSRTPIVLAGRRARIDQAAVGLVAAQRVSLRQSAAGAVFALKVSGDVRPLFGTQAALAFGVAFAVALTALQVMTRRAWPALRLPRLRRQAERPPVVAVVRRRLKVLAGD